MTCTLIQRQCTPALPRWGRETAPGPILEIGNTNSRYRFPIGARAFVNNWNLHGPAHHCAVGVGHLANKLEKLGALLGMKVQRVC